MLKTNIPEIKRIEVSIREIQKNIIKMKKDKKMIAKMSIISDLINHEWSQDLIETIRGRG